MTAGALPSLGAELCQAYEVVRAQALGQPAAGARPRGLALLLRSGLAAWVRAWETLAPLPPPSLAGAQKPATQPGANAELVLLLAQMALSAACQPAGANG